MVRDLNSMLLRLISINKDFNFGEFRFRGRHDQTARHSRWHYKQHQDRIGDRVDDNQRREGLHQAKAVSFEQIAHLPQNSLMK
jgi:hypothetical protein